PSISMTSSLDIRSLDRCWGVAPAPKRAKPRNSDTSGLRRKANAANRGLAPRACRWRPVSSRLRSASGFRCGDERVQRPEMALQCVAPGLGQGVPGHRLAVDEIAAQADIPFVLEAPQLGAEVAVGQFQLLLEAREADLAVAGEQHRDREAHAVFEDRVESVEGLHGHCRGPARKVAKPLHASEIAMTMPAIVHRYGGWNRSRAT